MADRQRIHPSPDLESAAAGSPVPFPTTPLLPSSAASSEKGDPSSYSVPPTTTTPPPRCHRLLRFLGCTLLFLIGNLTASIFLVFHPKLPHYSITGLHVNNLTLTTTNTLSSAFHVNITARNPNKRIGIYYEDNSRLSVWYNDTTSLCEGSLPVFYQGRRSTTVMQVALLGTVPNATVLAGEMKERSGGVALVIKGEVRVRVKMGEMKLKRRKVIKVRCEVVVDSLATDEEIHFKNSSCKIHIRFLGATFAT